ncbi:CAP domain-containing protein [Phenylobacterium sp.]|uniref:CAP domain-containing protein n=1 Tax=Phenylobacterium sp. TaxID=1871053 RepID=UPI0035AFC747
MRTPFRAAVLAVAAGFALLLVQPQGARAEGLEGGVLDEINFARAHPRQYAEELRSAADAGASRGGFESYADWDPGAFAEAIDFLMHQSPLPPLKLDARLSAAARDHVREQGGQGGVGHAGPGGETLGQRLQRRGVWAGLMAENISYGFADPRGVVAQLVIDSGVASRGHRKNIFGRAYQAAGVGCGRHAVYASMCVIDFAGALVAR